MVRLFLTVLWPRPEVEVELDVARYTEVGYLPSEENPTCYVSCVY